MRRRKSLNQLRRGRPTRTPRRRLLLVCEGEKTERIYFSLYLRDLRAANVRLEIAKRDCGSDPLSLVRYAKARMKEDRGIDECYCVIDRDTHEHFAEAVQDALDFQRSIGAKRTFVTTKSYPCFEYWFILHFEYTTSPYVRQGNRSAGDNAVRRLKDHVPNYTKNNIEVISSFLPLTSVAIANAKRALKQAVKAAEFNPSTEVHLLVERLHIFR